MSTLSAHQTPASGSQCARTLKASILRSCPEFGRGGPYSRGPGDSAVKCFLRRSAENDLFLGSPVPAREGRMSTAGDRLTDLARLIAEAPYWAAQSTPVQPSAIDGNTLHGDYPHAVGRGPDGAFREDRQAARDIRDDRRAGRMLPVLYEF